ncbi:hypothetical protein HPG69_001530 [Diceros bicornis minor]|uniref:Uncharacterized protein n=1 Tax=Diceros bicornis minor TaxID=77932 RepID=A0A7J7FFW4_DICBM|nr:hypothetical protein HPG69_001530 [Diceros bicornis minor]
MWGDVIKCSHPPHVQLKVVAGSHDIGFHYWMKTYKNCSHQQEHHLSQCRDEQQLLAVAQSFCSITHFIGEVMLRHGSNHVQKSSCVPGGPHVSSLCAFNFVYSFPVKFPWNA